jgi:hypothetical protein
MMPSGMCARQAVEEGTCLLEWDGPEHEAPAPLLKDMFAVERRKAKVPPAVAPRLSYAACVQLGSSLRVRSAHRS